MKFAWIYISLLIPFLLVSCTRKAIKEDLVDVKVKQKPLPKVVVEEPIDEKAVKIDRRAFHFFSNGIILEGLGDFEGAGEQFKRALQIYPKSYEIRYSLAEIYFRQRKFSDVIELLKVISPEDAQVNQLRGMAYMSNGNQNEAVEAFKDVIDEDPDNLNVYVYLSNYYRRVGDMDNLIDAYENIIRLIPQSYKYFNELASLYAQRGEFDKAKSLFQQSLEINKKEDNISAMLALSELYRMKEKYDSSLTMLHQAVEAAPNDIDANRELAMMYVRSDSLAKALPYAHKTVDLAPLDRTNVRRLAILYYGLDSLTTADSIFTYLVNSGERNAINHFYLGRIAALQKEYQIAADEFTILTQLADSVVDSWLDLGFAYRQLNKGDLEVKTYQDGLNHMPDEESAIKLMFALGAAYERNGQIEKAIDVFEDILLQRPSYDQALNYLGYMLADRGEKLNYAKELIEKALEQDPENAAYLDSYGWVYYKLEDYTKALIFLEKASALQSDPVIYDHLGDTYNATGKTNKAEKWWEKALELDPENKDILDKLNR